MQVLANIILANFFISLVSVIGVITVGLSERLLKRALLLLVAVSAGGLLGSAFFHLLPEAAGRLDGNNLYSPVILAFTVFFLIEKLLHWRHCHKGRCRTHAAFGQLNLLGDGVHNFIDGLIISGAFLAGQNLGWTTALAVALHEIPQEIGDFGVLLYSGYSRRKALAVNLFVGLMAVGGGVSGYWLAAKAESLIGYLLPFAAGGFIYIAASDLMPELRKETNPLKSLISYAVFLAGVALMLWIKD